MSTDAITKLLLEAPDHQLDASAKETIREWGTPATALQVLKTLDACVNGGLASGFVMQTLNALLDVAMRNEKTSLEALVPLATWRQA